MKDKMNELKLNLAGMKERLNVEFRLALEDILGEDRTTDSPVEELQEKADKMKKRLENLGEITRPLMKRSREMHKRYEFIREQKGVIW